MFNKMQLQEGTTIKPRNRFLLSGAVVVCAFLVLSSGIVIAQEPATSLEQLKLILEKGDSVTLVDPSGRNIKGRVLRIAADELDLKVNGNVRTFTDRDIRSITRQKPDSPVNGILIGAGVGFAATIAPNIAIAEGDTGLAVGASVLWALIGGGIGGIVDACVHEKQTIYFHPKSSASWSIRPIFSNPAEGLQNKGVDPVKGISVTVRF